MSMRFERPPPAFTPDGVTGLGMQAAMPAAREQDGLMRRCLFWLCAALLVTAVAGCQRDGEVMNNGYYSAVAASFSNDGWKPFITLYVSNNKIVTAEFNARNPSGLIFTWDVLSMRRMKARARIHPSRLIREYTQELLNRQSVETIRRVPGDDTIYDSFIRLAAAAMAQAQAGDKRLAEVEFAPQTVTP